MRTSRRMLRQVRRAMFIAFLFTGCINVLVLATPVYILQVFETVVPLGSIETLFVLTGIVAIAIAAMALVEVARNTIMLRAGVWLDHELGRHMLENGLKVERPAAELTADARALRQYKNYLIGNSAVPMFDAPWVPLFVAMLFVLNPYIGAIALAAAVALAMAVIAQLLFTSRLQAEGARAEEQAGEWLQKLAGQSQFVGALGLVGGVSSRWEWFNRSQIASAYSLGKRGSVIRVAARTVRMGAQIGVYAVGAWLVVLGELTPGALVASAILMARALAPLEQLVGTGRTIRTAWQAYRRLWALPQDMATPRVRMGDADQSGKLVLSGVTFYYPMRRTPALRQIDLELVQGECLGIVGPNGCGKSTLAALIAGAHSPTTGAADLDGIPIAKWQRADGEDPVGYMPDDPLLLEGTVNENIARFSDASLLSVAHAAMRVGVHDALHALPNGYETRLGPGGEGLSLREKRAVALARAVHGSPRIVVIDEPEIGMDGTSLRQRIECLKELKASGVSLAIATQDPKLLALTDKVALMAEGTIQSIASPEDILRRSSGANVVPVRQASAAPTVVETGQDAKSELQTTGAP